MSKHFSSDASRRRTGEATDGVSRRRFLKYSGATAAAGPAAVLMAQAANAASPTVKNENLLVGAPEDEWGSYQDDSIQGFTTRYSYLPGDTVTFKVKTDSKNYRIRVYRMGWYGGNGARRLADVTPSVTLPQTQPAPKTDAATGLVDCGNWAASATWTVPSGAVSGVYYALLERLDNSESNFCLFVVRRNGPSDLLVQTSETTWHAYNRYGGNSLYYGDPAGRAYKVSYNRPFEKSETESSFFGAEVSLVRFLERNGYDVAYCGGIDVHQGTVSLGNAKVFVSHGHDEYVSAAQRTRVTAARDAGTHLVFMTGNEYFWKVRFEPSIDGSSTADRTLVCYKETLDSAKTDPTSTWTGTWRDPRFSPPSDGGRPENELTGQLFRVILPTGAADDTITVPAEYAKLRFWRNTAVASLTTGQTRNLAPNTLGYEFDCDVDNGFRPAGLVRLSSTTVQVPQILQDYGATYAAGTITHNMTMYRASSGALVWGLGTVQWAYGLDSYHQTDEGSPTDVVMQQATVNTLADMGAQPTSLMSGLSAASASGDTLPPTVTITSPANGATVPLGSSVTVTGTAVDAGGGVVAAVEVSTDGGTTWHPATGRSSWSYVYTLLNTGPSTVKVRAVDDSYNIGAASTVSLTGGPRTLPCSIFPDSVGPTTPAADDSSAVEVGVKFRAAADGFVTGLRFYKGAGNTGTHVGHLWDAAGTLLGSATFVNETATGWQKVAITAVPIKADTTYVASVWMPVGRYAADSGFFAKAYSLDPLTALADGTQGGNGVYRAGSQGFPTATFGATNYWVDVVYGDDNMAAPTVVDTAPAAGLQSVAVDAPLRFTFSEPMTPASIAVQVVDAANTPVAGTTAYDAGTRSAVFTPSADLDDLTTYTATVTAAKDAGGTAMASPFTLTFTTVGPAGSSPASLWDTAAAPAAAATTDTSAIELGVRFTSDVAGTVTALRFHKAAGSPGAHVGHLWNAAGTLLATATFSGETASGWQQATLATPVTLTAGAVYTVSYYCPSGVYSYTSGGLSSPVVRAPLRTVSPSDGGNGVFRYGASGFPSSTYGTSNYWADVVFAAAADTTAPAVLSTSPAQDVVSVAPGSTVSATFSKNVNASTLVFTLTPQGGAAVGATVAYDAPSRTATLTPSSPLGAGKLYTASVTVKDTAGNAMASAATWSFRAVAAEGTNPMTLWDSSAVPATAAADDSSPIEVGVRVVPSATGRVTGVRFYKGAGNSGSHVGHLWTAGGTLLGTVAFTAESATGWQQASFPSPIDVTAGTPYVVSYFAPAGHYAVTPNGLASAVTRGALQAPASVSDARNGVFKYGSGGFPDSSYGNANYWVDLVFEDRTGPTVVARTPGSGATGVDVGTTVSATFGESVQASSVVLKLRDAGGGVVGGNVTYDDATATATFTPAAALAQGATYTASVEGATDLAGNPIAASSVWSFSTAGSSVVSIWPSTAVPGTLLTADNSGVELGLKFRASVTGKVLGVRFYKGGPANSGPHKANLWTSSGTLLATVDVGSESARGWQSATFATPVGISADTTYVVSYFAPVGRYSSDGGYFAGAPTTAGPLTALQNGTDGGNGLYGYGSSSVFPTGSYNGANYWVDVMFQPDAQ